MSQSEGAEMARRHGSSPAAPASPLEYEDHLREILLRPPPLPSSLLRASAVCERWRGVVTDPKFLSRFRSHHRKPPLLRVFEHSGNLVFRSILDPPDRIPTESFGLRLQTGEWSTLACRHGRALLMNLVLDELLVCDPITGDQHRMDLPPPFNKHVFNGAPPAAICADGHYGILVGNALHWLLQSTSDGILRLDMDGQSLAVIQGPSVTNDFCHGSSQIIQGEDGALGLAILSCSRCQMWQRISNHQGVATWVMLKTIEMFDILGLPPRIESRMEIMVGYAEDDDVLFLDVDANVYMLHLKSMQLSLRLIVKLNFY